MDAAESGFTFGEHVVPVWSFAKPGQSVCVGACLDGFLDTCLKEQPGLVRQSWEPIVTVLSYFLAIFKFYFCFFGPPTSLKMMPSGVASNSQSIGSSTLTATPIVPENMFEKMLNMCENVRKPRNLTHNQSNWSIHLKNPTNAHPKVSVFDIRLPYWTIFWDFIFWNVRFIVRTQNMLIVRK